MLVALLDMPTLRQAHEAKALGPGGQNSEEC